MDILTEQADTYDECIRRITERFGPNVHVLRQKKIRMGGFLGFFERDGVELSFILSREGPRVMPASTSAPARGADFDDERRRILQRAAEASPSVAARVAERIETLPTRPRPTGAPGASGAQDARNIEAILAAVRKLEQKVDRAAPIQEDEEHETIRKVESLLELNDFSASYTRSFVSRMKREFSLEDLDRYDYVQDQVIGWIGESIQTWSAPEAAKPRVIALVGPTGVGKTTTVAKLAAGYALAAAKGQRPLNVRVITIDNYRIGAKQQIEIYGNIMNIPVSCAETPSDLHTLMAMHADADVVLIDTIGKSPRDYPKIAEMRQFLDAAGSLAEVHLAMSATTKASDMREIMQQYETFGYRSVIVTKLDETTRVGNIVSVLDERKKPVSYVTTGQRVPQDFEEASAVRFLTNLEGFRVNRARIEERFPQRESGFIWS